MYHVLQVYLQGMREKPLSERELPTKQAGDVQEFFNQVLILFNVCSLYYWKFNASL